MMPYQTFLGAGAGIPRQTPGRRQVGNAAIRDAVVVLIDVAERGARLVVELVRQRRGDAPAVFLDMVAAGNVVALAHDLDARGGILADLLVGVEHGADAGPGVPVAVIHEVCGLGRRLREERRLGEHRGVGAVSGAKTGNLVTMLITPPVEPRPNMNDDGPFSTSTLSTVKLSRVYQPGSLTPSRKMSLRESNPRM